MPLIRFNLTRGTFSLPERLYTTIQIKSVDASQRLVTGYAAAAGNKDRVNDVIDSGAFARTLKESPDVLVFIGHDASRLPVGEPSSMAEDGKGLLTTTRVYNTPAGDELLEVAKQRMASGRTLGMSIGYRSVKHKYVGNVRHLQDVDLLEYSFLASPNLAANPEATVTGVKGRKTSKATTTGPVITTEDSYEDLIEDLEDAAEVALNAPYACVCATFPDHVIVSVPGMDMDDMTYWDIPYALNADNEPVLGTPSEVDPAFVPATAKARAIPHKEEPPVKVMTAEQKAALPDSAFAFIEPGALDDERKTVPRANRHFAHHAADGSIDTELLQAAIIEAEASEHGSKVLAHLKRHALKAGFDFWPHDGHDDAHSPLWSEGAAPSLLVIAAKMVALAEDVAATRQAMDRLHLDTKNGDRLNTECRARLSDLHTSIGQMLEWADSIERGDDGKMRVDLFRHKLAMLELAEVS